MMPSPIKAIIFDYGNILIEWDPGRLYRRYFPNDHHAMESFLAEINFMEWNAQQDRGRSFKEGIAILSNAFPHHTPLIEAYYDHWKDSISGSITGTVEILKRLKQAGFPVYGLSNWSKDTFPYARGKYDFFEFIDDMVISGFVGLAKPDPAIYQLLLGKINKPASECQFIADSGANINQTKQLGFKTIHFKSAEQLGEELQQMGLLKLWI